MPDDEMERKKLELVKKLLRENAVRGNVRIRDINDETAAQMRLAAMRQTEEESAVTGLIADLLEKHADECDRACDQFPVDPPANT